MIPCLFYQAMSKIFVMKIRIKSTPTCFTKCARCMTLSVLETSLPIYRMPHIIFRHFCLKLVSQSKFCQRFGKVLTKNLIETVTIQDTSFRHKCLKLRCEAFHILADWSPKQTMSCTLHTW